MILRAVVCGLIAAARLLELRWSNRNLAGQGASREGDLARQTYPAIVLLHTLTILVTFIRGRSGPSLIWLAVLLGVQPLRCWVLATLGSRWNARGAVPEALDVATTGPYALVRHPNYSVVLVELWALPAAFGLKGVAALATLANVLLLSARVRDEEALLLLQEDYRRHFEGLPRFVPYLF